MESRGGGRIVGIFWVLYWAFGSVVASFVFLFPSFLRYGTLRCGFSSFPSPPRIWGPLAGGRRRKQTNGGVGDEDMREKSIFWQKSGSKEQSSQKLFF